MSDGVAVRQSGIEDYLDVDGLIDLPPGSTLLSNFERNIAEFGSTAAYRYLDFTRDDDGVAIELSWDELNTRMRAIGARLQQVTAPGDRVAILAPQGLDYVIGFFAAIAAGNIAVPLFAPELPGHAERLDAVLADATPSVILTTDGAAESVNAFLRKLPRARRPRVIGLDAHSGGRTDHAPRCLHQCVADDLGRRPGHGHPQCELAAVVSRHGPDHDLVSAAVRRTHHLDVAVGVRAAPPPLDQTTGHRIRVRAGVRRRAQLRVRPGRPARTATGRRDLGSVQCRGPAQRIRTGHHRRHREIHRRIRPLRISPVGHQTLLRHGRSHPVGGHHRHRGPSQRDLPGP
ncbi:Probable acyl-CoA synthase FadD [Mycobacteroides abscessus subsp. bolletii]|nr:Probable acyl-CoA synthase FadD [Mycobacteroides abscessus subsp. bolletii]